MIELGGRIALVTGGAQGIGEGVARTLSRLGARVTVGDVLRDKGEAVAEGTGGDYVDLDVRSEDAWSAAVQHVLGRHGRVDVLVNVAGVGGTLVDPVQATLDEWKSVFAINTEGIFLGCRSVLPAMIEHGTGVICNISSVVTTLACARNYAYGASKAAVNHLTRSIASFGKEQGRSIRANCVQPGLVKTWLYPIIIETLAARKGLSYEATEREVLADIGVNRVGSVDDIANAVAFLCSDAASYITGTELLVDGGWHMKDHPTSGRVMNLDLDYIEQHGAAGTEGTQ